MQREMPYRVLVPQELKDPHEKLPVLYLLHGLFGCCDNWLELTNIVDYTAGRGYVIVMPEGGDGWYTDSGSVERDKYESYFTNELIPEIEGRFPVSTERAKRGIAGLSMGGYGAFKFALKQPNRFFFAGSMSGAFEAPHRTEAAPGFDWEILGPSVIRAFGEQGSARRKSGDVLRSINETDGDLPYFYLGCGVEDGFLPVNRLVSRLLKQKGIRHEFHEGPGGHGWSYWDAQLAHMLEVFEEKLSLDIAPEEA